MESILWQSGVTSGRIHHAQSACIFRLRASQPVTLGGKSSHAATADTRLRNPSISRGANMDKIIITPDTIEEKFTVAGYNVTVETDYDSYAGMPWENCDGHGVVSEWTTRDKKPGERVLHADGRSKLYYDVQESTRIALRDSWGPKQEGDTPRQTAARAVEQDFEYLRGFCRGDWYYITLHVTVSRNGEEIAEDYLGGVESINNHWKECAAEMAQHIINKDREKRAKAAINARREMRESRYWQARGMVTA